MLVSKMQLGVVVAVLNVAAEVRDIIEVVGGIWTVLATFGAICWY